MGEKDLQQRERVYPHRVIWDRLWLNHLIRGVRGVRTRRALGTSHSVLSSWRKTVFWIIKRQKLLEQGVFERLLHLLHSWNCTCTCSCCNCCTCTCCTPPAACCSPCLPFLHPPVAAFYHPPVARKLQLCHFWRILACCFLSPWSMALWFPDLLRFCYIYQLRKGTGPKGP